MIVGLEFDQGERGIFIWIKGVLDWRTLQLGSKFEVWDDSQGKLLLKEPLRGLGMGRLYNDQQRPQDAHQHTLKPSSPLDVPKILLVAGLNLVLALGCMVPFVELLEQFNSKKQGMGFFFFIPLAFFSALAGCTLLYLMIKPLVHQSLFKNSKIPSETSHWAQGVNLQNIEGSITYFYLVWIDQTLYIGQGDHAGKPHHPHQLGDWIPIIYKNSMGISVGGNVKGSHLLSSTEFGKL